jgi:hypothetical protein
VSDYTWASVYWMYSLMALFAVGALFFLWRAIRSGAVSGDEAPKYRMLEDEPPAGAPGEIETGLRQSQGAWGGGAPPEQGRQTKPSAYLGLPSQSVAPRERGRSFDFLPWRQS